MHLLACLTFVNSDIWKKIWMDGLQFTKSFPHSIYFFTIQFLLFLSLPHPFHAYPSTAISKCLSGKPRNNTVSHTY